MVPAPTRSASTSPSRVCTTVPSGTRRVRSAPSAPSRLLPGAALAVLGLDVRDGSGSRAGCVRLGPPPADAAATPAVAAVGAAERLELLPQDRHAAVPAVAGLSVQHDPVDEAGHAPPPSGHRDGERALAPARVSRGRRCGGRAGRAAVRPATDGTMLTTLRPRFVPNCDRARGEREQRVVAAAADQVARVELGAPLADQDLAGVDHLPAEPLHAEPLGVRSRDRCGSWTHPFCEPCAAPTSRSRCR